MELDGAAGVASDWRKKARVAAKIGVYLKYEASRWIKVFQVANWVHVYTNGFHWS